MVIQAGKVSRSRSDAANSIADFRLRNADWKTICVGNLLIKAMLFSIRNLINSITPVTDM
jgi:hypothetical protein